ncbi:MAG: hypothetical protein HZB92_07985 [Euryarchaeota archaeon]|nr:hypothetical protein [Euryarchaeota archaeon]
MAVITIAELRVALEEALGGRGMTREQIGDLANYVLSFFGHQDRIVDNTLTTADRDVFYMLDEAGLLSTSLEEVTIQKGKTWRIHYWILKKDRIHDLIRSKKKEKGKGEDFEVYGKLSDEAWEHKSG